MLRATGLASGGEPADIDLLDAALASRAAQLLENLQPMETTDGDNRPEDDHVLWNVPAFLDTRIRLPAG